MATSTSDTRPLALVTGGASGIGRAIVLRLLREGSRVIALDRSAKMLEVLEQECAGGPLVASVLDLSQTQLIPQAVAELIRLHGPITRLVNNAGIWPSAPIVEMSDEIWNASFAVNLTAPFALIRAVAPGMRQAGGGAIVNIASRNAFRSSTGKSAYDAAKAGLVALTRTAAGELASWNIRVNAICPGVVATPGDAITIQDKLFKAAYTRLIPMSRYADPAEIASVVWFLLSAGSSFLTGEAIVVDGGQLACQDNARFMEIPGLNP